MIKTIVYPKKYRGNNLIDKSSYYIPNSSALSIITRENTLPIFKYLRLSSRSDSVSSLFLHKIDINIFPIT
ncbi:MAG: hypothetical protein MRJ93_02695 [Nitrososphaeraceae archaeon]|nr:hypothetical protein [Nitrososphaeraceae archaeon]